MYWGYIFIIIAALFWGFLGVFGRLAMAGGVAPLEVAFWRALIGGICMLIHAYIVRDVYIRQRKDIGVFILFGFFSIAIFFAVYQYAVQEGGVALASVLLYTAPAWVAFFSRIFFNIPFTVITCTAIGLALIGVALISFSSIGQASVSVTANLPFLGIIWGLLSGFLYATHYIVTKKYLRIYTPFTLYGFGSLVAAFCLFPFVDIRLDFPVSVWMAIVGIAVLSTYLAYWAYCEGIKRLDPTKAAVIATLEPVIATVAAWYIWAEQFTTWGWIGSLLIVSTVIIFLIDETKRSKISV